MENTVHGHHVEGDNLGITGLRGMTEKEAITLFEDAHQHGKAYFEHEGRHFELARVAATPGGFLSGSIDKFLVAETKRPTGFF